MPIRWKVFATFFSLLVLILAPAPLPGSTGIQFRADNYQRDLGTNTAKGRGNAWIKTGGREIWADEIEFDFSTEIAVANGNVRVKEKNTKIWCSHVTYHMNGHIAAIEDAIITSQQVVLTGSTIERTAKNKYTIKEGSYSNCNVDLINATDIEHCKYDWKIYGRLLEITVESYAHIYDAIAYIKDLPILYSPYLIAPVKSKRQSGLLTPQFTNSSALGSGFSWPYFQVLGSWHDLTLTPTLYSKAGYHLGLQYRYAYSKSKTGNISIAVTKQQFSDDPDNPVLRSGSERHSLGFIGEWALKARNIYFIDQKTYFRQVLQLVSHPYYSQDYGSDIGPAVNFSYLRSQLTFVNASDHFLTTSQIKYHQSLIISKESGVDDGAVVSLPSLSFSRTSSPLLGNLLSYEWDNHFSNYFRSSQFDQVPTTRQQTGVNTDDNLSYDYNDYIRTGRRFRTEPRLIVHIPMPPGFQFQPILKAGGVFYHFDFPSSQVVHREYFEAEFPLSLYLSKTFSTNITGFEKINHVLQPRIIYAVRPYQNLSSNHPFFCQDPTTGLFKPGLCEDSVAGLSNPRFDIYDHFSKYEYLRFELINRFRRKWDSGIERFFLLQLAQQYNLRVYETDPRFFRRLGPIEILSEIKIWRFHSQLQATYDLETTTTADGSEMHENSWSGSITYTEPNGSNIALSTLLRNKAKRSLTAQSLYLSSFRTLPTFFDIQGSLEYSMKHGELLGYEVGFYFSEKPRSCWKLLVATGRNSYKEPFTRVNFQLSFGGANDAI